MPRRQKKTFPLTVNVDDGVYNLVLRDPSVATWRALLSTDLKDGSDIDLMDATMTFLEGAIESIDCVEDLFRDGYNGNDSDCECGSVFFRYGLEGGNVAWQNASAELGTLRRLTPSTLAALGPDIFAVVDRALFCRQWNLTWEAYEAASAWEIAVLRQWQGAIDRAKRS